MTEVMYEGDGAKEMHLQGRRWGGSIYGGADSLFSTPNTFLSYGVDCFCGQRAMAVAVSQKHKDFLRRLRMALDIKTRCGWRLLCVHAGFKENVPLEDQL